MKNKKSTQEGSSLKMLLVYFALVLSLIITAFIFRAVTVINNSNFDGENRFTVALANKGVLKGILSFEPSTSSLSVLKISPEFILNIEKMNSRLGLIPDGYIISDSLPGLDKPVSTVMRDLLFQFGAERKNITSYDIFQLWYYSTKIPSSTIYTREIGKNTAPQDNDKNIALLFPDDKLASENLSLQIINAAGVTGMGARLERVLSNIGGNIVSIQTAQATQKISKISYFDKQDSYTLIKISRLLPFNIEKMSRQGIADIIITIGEDNKKTNIF